MTQYITRLPAVFQTTTEKKFFDATFDQVFSKKDSDLLAGYIGRRNPGSYNPITDFYLPEPSKDRTWWQLEATAFARNADTTKSNIFFYNDLLEKINYYGGNTLNQDRLFESEYYSFGPPIDYDMFINYQNYYWIEQGLPSIIITAGEGRPPIMAIDIIGKSTYTTPDDATPANLTLSTGMKIILSADPDYSSPHTIENMGGCIGIALVPQFPDFTPGTIYENLPWDGSTTLSTGRLIQNYYWDANTWDTEAQPNSGDYITIERGCIDRNAWSRTNKWFHLETINKSISVTKSAFPANASSGLRPIIQFNANIPLYKSGSQFKAEIQYGFVKNEIGNPFLLSSVQGKELAAINETCQINLLNGDLVCFFDDATPCISNFFNWDKPDQPDPSWSTLEPLHAWDEGEDERINRYIFVTNIMPNGTVLFYPKTSYQPSQTVDNGDIVFIRENLPGRYNAKRGETWYYTRISDLDPGVWNKAYNDKIRVNQPPKFELYDHDGVSLDDSGKYPNSDFVDGNKIFSYKINTTPGATVDPVLGFPIVYTSLALSSDITFQNNLITDRYTYSDPNGTARLPIEGYYYYKTRTNSTLNNSWNLYDLCPCPDITPAPPCNCIETSKQRVINQYVVGYGTEYQFELSVTPYGYPTTDTQSPDIIVLVNSAQINPYESITNPLGYTIIEINNSIYVDLNSYLTQLLSDTQLIPPVVEIQTYTHALLDPEASGYFQIPQQLEANPTQLEVTDISASNLIQQFSSIISNQIGFSGVAFGGNNNYRDSRKNGSVGLYILQNLAPALKSMLVSSSDDLDFVAGIRFSQDEYTKFKNKYLTVALQLINQEFNPRHYQDGTIDISIWVGQILKVLNVSKEFSNSFAYSYMAASGVPTFSQVVTVPSSGLVTLANYIDLADLKNVMYVYDITDPLLPTTMLLVGKDYNVISTNNIIQVKLSSQYIGKILDFYLYKDPLPTYIPSTPSKLGTYSTYIPRIELDTSYIIPTNVIIGHDGSKTIAYGDYRDQLLLEIERRIYNGIVSKFRDEYYVPLRVESVKSGCFRQTRYSRQEYLDITESYLNKWSAKNRANYRANDWVSASEDCPPDELWKLYNYRDALNGIGRWDIFGWDIFGYDQLINLSGNWKGIFQYFYDTYYPNTRPWEMLGFSQQPSWWVEEYGAPTVDLAGQSVWTSTSQGLHNMWGDLEAGIIRQGPSAIFDPVTLQPQPQPMWARPGLSTVMPVDSSGNIIPVPTIFHVVVSGNPYAPFDGFDAEWIYGDGAPVEQAWMSTSAYAYSTQEFLYLMRPGPFGELLWDTLGTTLSPGQLIIPNIKSPVMSATNWQYVQNDKFTSDDPFFTWMRPKNKDQIVHAEIVDTIVQIRLGYQSWISDRILFLGKDIASTFGQKVRTLDVNLANKFAGFTNKDTTNTYIESISPGATTNTLIIPSNNFNVLLHKSPPADTYSYSGVIIRALADGTFAIYGYDLLNASFKTLNRTNNQLIDISIGGTPAEFQYFTSGATYRAGDIVRYNGVYYVSLSTQTVQSFVSKAWQKLKSLPISGGISVTYRPISDTTITSYAYGTVFNTPQQVFDFLIGWGAWLEAQGWQFRDVNEDTNQVNDWLASAKQFLFWLNTDWAVDASIQLSPLANSATLIVKRGYPDDVETLTNGIYSILDKYGVAIAPVDTVVNRDGLLITVSPSSLSVGGIYFLQINASETEHILIFDNTTSFNDVVYSPLLRARQQRLRFNGFRSNGWYGKMEAPGYLVIADQLVPNFDTIVSDMRYYYDSNYVIDNPSLEDLGRHLIGYESKSYLDNLQVSNDVQYLFYQGAIRQKGTKQALEKLFKSSQIRGVENNEIIEVYEEWALKLSEFGNTIEQVSTEFILKPEQNTGEVIVTRLNFVPSSIGFVREISILNAENTYTKAPIIIIDAPDISSDNTALKRPVRQATAFAILDSESKIARIDIIDPGYGYSYAPVVIISSGNEQNNLDRLYSAWQGEIIVDTTLDNIIDISIDEIDVWTVRPATPSYSLEFPVTNRTEYSTPNAGYVNFNDVTYSRFDVNQTAVTWGTTSFNPVELETIWVAKTFTEDWGVYKLVNIAPETFDVYADANNDLFLRTDSSYLITPQFSTTGNVTDFGNMIVLQVIEAQATIDPVVDITDGAITSITLTKTGANYNAVPTVTITSNFGSGATAIATIAGGIVSGFTITDPGTGYVPVGATATIESTNITAGKITSITLDQPGEQYNTAPEVIINSNFGTGATATAIINSSGVVIGFAIIDPGTGYVPIGATATIDPVTDITDGKITSITLDQPGEYDTPPAVTINGTGFGATAEATVYGGKVTGFIITDPGSGYISATVVIAEPVVATVIISPPIMTINVEISPPTSVGSDTNYTVGFTFDSVQTDSAIDGKNYYNLVTLTGNPISATDIPQFNNFTKLMLFKTMRFMTIPVFPDTPSYISVSDKIWIDAGTVEISGDNPGPRWGVYTCTYTLESGIGFTAFRTQQPLINSSLFQSASVFNNKGTELVQLPIYDPFKSILPGPARQNITYMTLLDPASYNVTSDPRLFSENITFGEQQVGRLWWDLSQVKYVYYEQPIAQDGSETENDNLVYRRDYWGQIFPGSTIAIYEWVKSPVPPAQYTGTGIPRDITTYVQLATSNRFTNITETSYYFWVLNTTDQPNIENRTMAALDVSLMLQSPRSRGFAFFCPIQQTTTNNSYMFYNVQEILAYQGNNVQIQYRVSLRDDQKHAQWSFFREGDAKSIVTPQYWNKMTDSLCAYTQLLPVTDEFSNGIIIAKNLPWDIFGWDISEYDQATLTSVPEYGQILPVPDPLLSNAEKYGILYRPRQGMFVKLQAARKVFVQAANSLLKYIPVRNTLPTWNSNFQTDTEGIYWQYITCYKKGYENVVPTVIYASKVEVDIALTTGVLQLGDIVENKNNASIANPGGNGRYILYAVVDPDDTGTNSLITVGQQNSAIELMSTVYTATDEYNLSTTLRELLNSFRTEIMTNEHFIDQNELFFSMLNYVLSEQKNPNWVFKSSYIYIKDTGLTLSQDQLYVPDQITNIIDYIKDSKPYHTQVRDYTSVYSTLDSAFGTVEEFVNAKFILQFGGEYSSGQYVNTPQNNLTPTVGWDIDYDKDYDEFLWDSTSIADIIPQFISVNNTVADFVPAPGDDWPTVNTISLSGYTIDESKMGKSHLYPITFTLSNSNLYLNSPQTFIPPANIVSVQNNGIALSNGEDFYVEVDNTSLTNTTYTIYFYNDPGSTQTPQFKGLTVLLLWDGGQLTVLQGNVPRSEIAMGFPTTNLVINVDTKLPVNISTGVPTPYLGWGDVWESVDGPVADVLIDQGGSDYITWDPVLDLDVLANTISFKENTNTFDGTAFYRNAEIDSGTLVYNIPSPIAGITDNTEVITVTADTDVFPEPDDLDGAAFWVGGERIEYKLKEPVSGQLNTWELKLIRRATQGTSATEHNVMIPSLEDPLVLVKNPVWIEKDNIMPEGANITVWNASRLPAAADDTSALGASFGYNPWGQFIWGNQYTSIRDVPLGGLWYAQTPEAVFLTESQGISIP